MTDLLKSNHEKANILIVDDTPANLRILSDMLKGQGYEPRPVPNGRLALRAVESTPPDLILLDISMPEMDGYEVCQALKENGDWQEIPVIFISALTETLDKVKAFSAGGVDYITKPFQIDEVIARIEAHLSIQKLHRDLKDTVNRLEERVQEQVKEISEAQFATIFALAKLSESRDDETGKHLERVRVFCKLLATWLRDHADVGVEISDAFITHIFQASPLHDIGKVGIPDHILLKPGRLTADEFEIMKQHTVIGAHTLEAVFRQYPQSQLIQMGSVIARSHHERWDGSGYPDGLSGRAIPLAARIMAVADVYDALRSRRVYKPAFSQATACEIIETSSGSHLDPEVVHAFGELAPEFGQLYDRMQEDTEKTLIMEGR